MVSIDFFRPGSHTYVVCLGYTVSHAAGEGSSLGGRDVRTAVIDVSFGSSRSSEHLQVE